MYYIHDTKLQFDKLSLAASHLKVNEITAAYLNHLTTELIFS